MRNPKLLPRLKFLDSHFKILNTSCFKNVLLKYTQSKSYLPTYLPTYLLTYLPTYPPTHLPTYLPWRIELWSSVLKEGSALQEAKLIQILVTFSSSELICFGSIGSFAIVGVKPGVAMMPLKLYLLEKSAILKKPKLIQITFWQPFYKNSTK